MNDLYYFQYVERIITDKGEKVTFWFYKVQENEDTTLINLIADYQQAHQIGRFLSQCLKRQNPEPLELDMQNSIKLKLSTNKTDLLIETHTASLHLSYSFRLEQFKLMIYAIIKSIANLPLDKCDLNIENLSPTDLEINDEFQQN